MTKTNLALVVGLLGALIAPQAMEVNFEPLSVKAEIDGLITLTANKDVSWVVLGEGNFKIASTRTIVLSKPVKVIAISSGDYVLWDPETPVPFEPPPVPFEPPVDQLAVLIESWVPESDDCEAVSENLEVIARKIAAGELSSPDMIMASLVYSNRKDKVGKEWAEFVARLADLMHQRDDWGKIFKTASEVCYEAAQLS
jgi:hypothetical protein